MRTVILLAVLGLLSACSRSHGVDDAGPGIDAPGSECSPRPTSYLEMACPTPAPGATSASLSITTSPTVCCSGGTATPRVTRAGDAFTVDLSWIACDCCEACRCVGPIETSTVALDGLETGHTYTVTAGGVSCSFSVPTTTGCRSTSVGQTRMPRVVMSTEPVPVTLQSVTLPGSCSCTPSLSTSAGPEVGILACDCCDECDCVDYLYEVSGTLETPPVGDHMVTVTGGTPAARPLATRDPGSCRPGSSSSLEVIGPSPEARIGGPAWWWVRAQGTELVCCAEPLPVLVALEGGPGSEFSFQLQTCTADPCDCVPKEPTRWETWALLGEIAAPGAYRVTVGTMSVDFAVPLGP